MSHIVRKTRRQQRYLISVRVGSTHPFVFTLEIQVTSGMGTGEESGVAIFFLKNF